jgi:hypothetical protein
MARHRAILDVRWPRTDQDFLRHKSFSATVRAGAWNAERTPGA